MKKTTDEELNAWRYQYPSTAVSWNLNGDETSCQGYIGEAKNLLYGLKNRMKLGGLKTLQAYRNYPDGTRIIVQSVFGMDMVNIYSNPYISEAVGIAGVMAQYENGRIFFKSQDTTVIENSYIDLRDYEGLYLSYESARILKLVQENATAGLLVLHILDPPYRGPNEYHYDAPGTYSLILFQLKEGTTGGTYTYDGIDYAKCDYEYKKSEIADVVLEEDTPMLDTSTIHPNRVITDPSRTTYSWGVYTPFRVFVYTIYQDCLGVNTPCNYYAIATFPAGSTTMDPENGSYNVTINNTSGGTQGYWNCGEGTQVGCGGEDLGYTMTRERGIISIDTHHRVTGNIYGSDGPNLDSGWNRIMIIGADIQYKEPFSLEQRTKQFVDLEYELVGAVEGTYELSATHGWRVTFSGALAADNLQDVRYGTFPYSLHFTTKCQGNSIPDTTPTWGTLENVLGYQYLYFNSDNPLSFITPWYIFPEWGGNATFLANGAVEEFEKITKIYEAHRLDDGTWCYIFGTHNYSGVTSEVNKEMLYIVTDSDIVPRSIGMNSNIPDFYRLTFLGNYVHVWLTWGTLYCNNMQKGGGFTQRYMARTAGNILFYNVSGTLYYKDEFGATWETEQPPMSQTVRRHDTTNDFDMVNTYGPVSMEILSNIRKRTDIAVCDSTCGIGSVSLTGKFPGKKDVTGICEFKPKFVFDRTFGCGRQADYAIVWRKKDGK